MRQAGEIGKPIADTEEKDNVLVQSRRAEKHVKKIHQPPWGIGDSGITDWIQFWNVI